MTIQDMQEAIMADGWRFSEQTFNDGSGEVYIELSQEEEGNIGLFSRLTYDDHGNRTPRDNIGWGRFQRQDAWERAYQYIIVNKRYLQSASHS